MTMPLLTSADPASLVITVAPNGARRSKADHPRLPLTTKEIAAATAEAHERGAAMLHLHIRDRDGRHSLDAETYRDVLAGLDHDLGRRVVIQITTEAAGLFDRHTQMATVREVRPEAVSLGLRELIPDDDALGEAAAFLAWCHSTGLFVQYILYDTADVVRFQDYRHRGVIPERHPFALLVLGRYSDAQEGRPEEMLALLTALQTPTARELPWALCAFGPREGACVATAAGLGGHVRVGFENNLQRWDGSLAESSADLVAQIRDVSLALGRRPVDADAARALFTSWR